MSSENLKCHGKLTSKDFFDQQTDKLDESEEFVMRRTFRLISHQT